MRVRMPVVMVGLQFSRRRCRAAVRRLTTPNLELDRCVHDAESVAERAIDGVED